MQDTNAALALDPAYAKAQHRRATALNALGQKAAALADLEAVAVSLPNSTQVHDELASLRAQLAASTTPVNPPSCSTRRGAATPAKAAAIEPPTPSQRHVRLPVTEEDSEDDAQAPSAASPPAAAAATGERRRLVIEESDHRCVDACRSGGLLCSPHSPPTHLMKARLTRLDGEAAYSESEDDMELAERRCQATAQKEEGNAAFRRGDVAKAAACFTRSLELDPTSPAVYANLAAAYLKAGAFQQAEASADSALLLDEGYVKAFHRRAAARTALGKLPEAKADLERVLQSLPGNPQVLEELRNLRLRSDTAARSQKAGATKATPSPLAKTLADFEKASRTMHDNPAALAAYVRSMQCDFAGLFKDQLDPKHIAAFAVALSDDSYCVQQPLETLNALQALSQVRRFRVVAMLMSKDVRATFSSIFDRLSGHCNDMEATKLRKEFGCK